MLEIGVDLRFRVTMITIYFKTNETAALMEHCRRMMARADDGPRREGRKRNLDEVQQVMFWENIYWKLEAVFRHPTCCWCDSRAWDLDVPDSIPDIDEEHPHLHLPPTWN